MTSKPYRPEEIVAKLRESDAALAQGKCLKGIDKFLRNVSVSEGRSPVTNANIIK